MINKKNITLTFECLGEALNTFQKLAIKMF